MHSSFNNTVGKKIMKRINAFISKKLIIAGIITSSLGVAGAAGTMAFKEGMFAKVSGQQAAAAAVAEVGGVVKDVDYKYKQHLGGRYKVEILKDGVEYEALVDAQNGKGHLKTIGLDRSCVSNNAALKPMPSESSRRHWLF